MKNSPLPTAELARLKALHEYQILDTPREASYDFITTLAAQACGTPMAFISIVDSHRQWFKSTYGFTMTEIPTDDSLCAHTVNNPGSVFVIEDLHADARFAGHSFVKNNKNIGFYAGTTIINSEGHVLGTLCVLDVKPKAFPVELRQLMLSLAAQAETLLEAKKNAILLQQKQTELKMAYADIENIAYIASHDLKTPINNIISLAHLIKEQYGSAIGTEGAEYINFINEASYYLSDLVAGIHSYSKACRLPVDSLELVHTTTLVEEIVTLLKIPANCTLNYNIGVADIYVAKAALKQVLFHLLINAIQYNDKEQGNITINISDSGGQYLFAISDTGEGIAENERELAFGLFKRLKRRDKNGENMGIGLTIARRLVEKMHGAMTLKSEPGKGSTFMFTVPKHDT